MTYENAPPPPKTPEKKCWANYKCTQINAIFLTQKSNCYILSIFVKITISAKIHISKKIFQDINFFEVRSTRAE